MSQPGSSSDLNAERWKLLYDVHIERAFAELEPGEHFTGADLHGRIAPNIGHPEQPNLWGAKCGAFLKRMEKDGRIRLFGITTKTTRSNHNHAYRVYAKQG